MTRGFSKLQVVGGTCPRPVGLWPLDVIVGVIGAVSRSDAQGGPGLRLGAAGRLCAGGSRGLGTVLRGTRAGTRMDYKASGMGAHVCPCHGEKTRHGRQVMSDIRTGMSRLFGSKHQQSTKTSTSDFSTTTNPIETIQKPTCSKLSLLSYEPSILLNIFKS